jgi:hypothetical protein
VAFRSADGFPEYVPAAVRRARAAARLAKLRREGRSPSPVVVEGRELATTFWGKAWCAALEAHADLATRLPRGRTYVRSGAVIDLRIDRGEVRAVVCGTDVYDVEVRIAPLAPGRWEAVRRACAGRIATVVELLSGRLSSAVMEVLCRTDDGLFPATRELQMSCSCPDHAWLCKHVAAVLYGVGARLDHAPELLFTLRGVDAAELASAAGDARALAGDAPADAPLGALDLGALFGIELERAPAAVAAAALPGRRNKPVRAKKKRRSRSVR